MDLLYFSILSLLIGAVVGSFLNVVIYRLPRDLSVSKPLRSFCPECDAPIAWYDNIPVLSFIRLHGRCRHCQAPISLQYPFVELATALVFLIVYDAFFVTRQRLGIGQIETDWPMLISHWILFAGLIALVVMDLEAYMVDIRVTQVITVAGLVFHGMWTPVSSHEWIRPATPQAGLTLAATLGLFVSAIVLAIRRRDAPPGDASTPRESPWIQDAESVGMPHPDPSDAASGSRRWWWLAIPVMVLLAYLLLTSLSEPPPPFEQPARHLPERVVADQPVAAHPETGFLKLLGGLACAFIALALAASHPHPEADTGIVESITEEADDSRRRAFAELLFLTPAVLLSGLVLVCLNLPVGERLTAVIADLLRFEPVAQWRPFHGLSTALTGWILGGALGWLMRIVFTLVLRKEALGMGDVHMLAAAGAVAGWPVAIAGFFLAACLALPAVMLIGLRRQSRALPYGPWLALGFLVAAVFQDRILVFLQIRGMIDAG